MSIILVGLVCLLLVVAYLVDLIWLIGWSDDHDHCFDCLGERVNYGEKRNHSLRL